MPSEIPVVIARALWLIFPAYVANGFPVLFNGRIPIDGGMNFSDGNRVFGDGKTVDGFFFGFFSGSMIGFLQNALLTIPEIQTTLQIRPLGWKFPVLLTLGALLGDIFASFVKRRMGISHGKPILGVDQLDFVVGATLLVSIVMVPGWKVLFVWLIVTPWIHIGANILAYKLNLKSKPY